MEQQGLKQSSLDPCLFVGKKVIARCYADDILFYAHQGGQIDHIIALLKQDRILIQKEGLGCDFLCQTDKQHYSQKRLLFVVQIMILFLRTDKQIAKNGLFLFVYLF